MIKFKTFYISFMLVLISFGSYSQQYARHTPLIGAAKVSVGYLERLPDDYYSDSTKQYPCIIFIHGSGERGVGTDTDLNRVKNAGPPKFINQGHKMCFTNPSTGLQECFIVLSPQTNKWSWKTDALIFAKWALTKYKIDPNRFYCTGLSMGGEGTWFAACFADNDPNIWAAIAPVCGRASYTDGTNVAKKKISLWAYHGSADTSIPLYSGLNPVLGFIGAGGTQRLDVIPGGSHYDAWDRAYRVDHTFSTPNLYEWFLTQKKQ
jgi:predicted peptidase